jgi:hypothetical protein
MYYIMSTQFSAAFNNPQVATYDEGKIALSGVAPENFQGKIIDLTKLVNSDSEPWTSEQFVPLIDSMRAETPTGALVIITDSLGQYLYANHPAFVPLAEPTTP